MGLGFHPNIYYQQKLTNPEMKWWIAIQWAVNFNKPSNINSDVAAKVHTHLHILTLYCYCLARISGTVKIHGIGKKSFDFYWGTITLSLSDTISETVISQSNVSIWEMASYLKVITLSQRWYPISKSWHRLRDGMLSQSHVTVLEMVSYISRVNVSKMV